MLDVANATTRESYYFEKSEEINSFPNECPPDKSNADETALVEVHWSSLVSRGRSIEIETRKNQSYLGRWNMRDREREKYRFREKEFLLMTYR